MRRFGSCALALAIAFLFTFTAETSAQAIFVGVGATVPTGEYGDFAKTGFMGFGGVLFPVGDGGVSVGAQGFWGANDHDTEGDETNLYGGMALVGINLNPEARVSPFVFGGLGLMVHSFKSDTFPDESDSGLAASLGGGLNFPVGGIAGMVAASYNMGFGDIDGTDFLGISAGVQIPVGGS